MTKMVQKNHSEAVSLIRLAPLNISEFDFTVAPSIPSILRIVSPKRKLTARSDTTIDRAVTGQRMRLLMVLQTTFVWRTSEASIVMSRKRVSRVAATLFAYADDGTVE